MYINKAQILGNITKQPELKALPGGTNVCSFSVATNRVWKDKSSGQKKEQVEFHNVVAFGKTGELVAQYMTKGSQVLVDGRIQTRSWDGTDGKKNYRTEIIADNVQFGNKPKMTAEDANRDTSAKPHVSNTAAPVGGRTQSDIEADPTDGSSTGFEYPNDDIDAGDIPF